MSKQTTTAAAAAKQTTTATAAAKQTTTAAAKAKLTRQQKCVARIIRAAAMLRHAPMGDDRDQLIHSALVELDALQGVLLDRADEQFFSTRGPGRGKIELAVGAAVSLRLKLDSRYPGITATTMLAVRAVEGKYVVVARPDGVQLLVPRGHLIVAAGGEQQIAAA